MTNRAVLVANTEIFKENKRKPLALLVSSLIRFLTKIKLLLVGLRMICAFLKK